jgi:hypothetical protein
LEKAHLSFKGECSNATVVRDLRVAREIGIKKHRERCVADELALRSLLIHGGLVVLKAHHIAGHHKPVSAVMGGHDGYIIHLRTQYEVVFIAKLEIGFPENSAHIDIDIGRVLGYKVSCDLGELWAGHIYYTNIIY